MLLESLEAQNFRNLNGKILCGKGLNIIFGENGQGKTNWLEAIYLLATTKSFKTAKLSETICFGEELAIVKGVVQQSAEIHRNLQVFLQANTKTLSVNNKKETINRYLGELHAVIFNSDELEIVRASAEARRKFLDGGIVWRYAIPSFLALGPMFFSGVIFARSFRDSKNPDAALGANIAGCVAGGLCESFSMLIGFRYLLVLAMLFYLLSGWTPMVLNRKAS